MRRFTVLAAATAVLLVAGLPGISNAATTDNNVAPNSSFESVAGGALACWQLTGTSARQARMYLTRDTHTGAAALRVDGAPKLTGDLAPTQLRTAKCATPVVAGRAYEISVWYRSNVSVRFQVDSRSADGTWKRWLQGDPSGSTGGTWTRASLVTPVVPTGTSLISVGVAFAAKGLLLADDLTVVQAPAGPTTLFQPSFPAAATATLVTNEYAYWNPGLPESVVSPDWEMTSG
jgi:hypothetical protein